MSEHTGGEEGSGLHSVPAEGGEGAADVRADAELDEATEDQAGEGAAQHGKGRVD